MRKCVLTEIVGFWKDVQSAQSDAHACVRRVVCTHVCMSTDEFARTCAQSCASTHACAHSARPIADV